MGVQEFHWELASHVLSVLLIVVTAWMAGWLLVPFAQKRRIVCGAAFAYFIVLLFCRFCPWEMSGRFAYAMAVAALFFVFYLCDRRRPLQKCFLAVFFYLAEWIVYGVTQLLWDKLFSLMILLPGMSENIQARFWLFYGCGNVWIFLYTAVFYGVVRCFHSLYVIKNEEIDPKEFLLLISPLFVVIAGLLAFSYYADIYELDMGCYIWEVHTGFSVIKLLYQSVSLVVLFIVVWAYQRIKQRQREATETAVFLKQTQEMRRHIAQVETLYADMRSIRHDMANHILTLERLCMASEAKDYVAHMQKSFDEVSAKICTGNPVTDVICEERKREAEKKGIIFDCDFIYPKNSRINVFDVSAILNNALDNAFAASEKVQKGQVLLRAFCNKNAYMIEIKNRYSGSLRRNADTGLFDSTKSEKGHGYGLINIGKVARSYQGDIDIALEDGWFVLSVMLMME